LVQLLTRAPQAVRGDFRGRRSISCRVFSPLRGGPLLEGIRQVVGAAAPRSCPAGPPNIGWTPAPPSHLLGSPWQRQPAISCPNGILQQRSRSLRRPAAARRFRAPAASARARTRALSRHQRRPRAIQAPRCVTFPGVIPSCTSASARPARLRPRTARAPLGGPSFPAAGGAPRQPPSPRRAPRPSSLRAGLPNPLSQGYSQQPKGSTGRW
jgi:hypothetical protein